MRKKIKILLLLLNILSIGGSFIGLTIALAVNQTMVALMLLLAFIALLFNSAFILPKEIEILPTDEDTKYEEIVEKYEEACTKLKHATDILGKDLIHEILKQVNDGKSNKDN